VALKLRQWKHFFKSLFAISNLKESQSNEESEVFDEGQSDHEGAGESHVQGHERHLAEVGSAVPEIGSIKP
jgi:hypothetical protein